MKLGAYTACLHDRPIAEALKILRDLGLDSAEINSGGFLPAPHLPAAEVRASKDARDEYLDLFTSTGGQAITPPSGPLLATKFLTDSVKPDSTYFASNGAGVKETSRLISRLRHREFGCLLPPGTSARSLRGDPRGRTADSSHLRPRHLIQSASADSRRFVSRPHRADWRLKH